MTAAVVEVIHGGVPGRVRYRARSLLRDDARSQRLERALGQLRSVRSAQVNARTGSVLITFDPNASREEFEAVLRLELGADPRLNGWARRGSRLVASALGVAVRAAGAHSPEVPRMTQALLGKVERAQSWLGRNGVSAERKAELQSASKPILKRPPAAALVSAERQEQHGWHAMELREVCARLNLPSSAITSGLAEAAARTRLAEDGANALTPPPRRSELAILVDQLTSTPVIMLGASAALTIATGGFADAVAILLVIGVNAGIGFVIESGAERTIAALSAPPRTSVLVRRGGVQREIPAEELVRGDLLVLAAGVVVCADARLVETDELTIDESSLTGESVPVLKHAVRLHEGPTPLGERTSMIYRGTLVTGGSGLGIVVATGDSTEIGRIQHLAGNVVARETPMQQQLDRLGKQLALGAGAACVATLGIGLLRGQPWLPMMRTAVSLAVAAVPEGLPTVAITTLALGLRRMREEHVLVRQLAAVETLGAVQIVCFDKTGTLTANRMTVVSVQAGTQPLEVRNGSLLDANARAVSAVESPDLTWLLRVAVLCNEVEVAREEGVWVLKGSPTEGALVQLALDCGIDVLDVRAKNPCLRVQRRAQTRSYMTTLHRVEGRQLVAVKGRPSEVLALCSHYTDAGERKPLTDARRAAIETENDRMAGQALRVLGFAFLDYEAPTHSELPAELVWLGLVGMEDPPRPNVNEIIARFRRAGVRTVMITGDQSATAQSVGRQTGLSENGHLEIVDSTRLDQVEPAVLAALADRAHIFSRVSPVHKLQIVQALQQAGHVVAMTGDGVNDGPALKAADIGIAMGGGGPTAARAVADVVLEDDELATLVLAIEQGRTIYEDIRKAVHFILATNLGEIIYTLVCTAGLGAPLTPMQLLWINLLTDVFPELALAVEPPESDVLARPPRDPARPMFTHNELWRIGIEGTVITAGALAAYRITARRFGEGAHAGTVGFTALTLAQLLHALSARSETHSVFDSTRLAKSRWMPLALGGTVGMQLLGNLLPPLRRVLGTVPLGLGDWALVLASAGVPFVINEGLKVALRPPRALPEPV